MRRAARKDANHASIVGAFKACGAQVLDLSGVGNGCPDLLVLHRGKLRLIEVKDGAKCKSARKLTKYQVELHRDWQVSIVETLEQVVTTLRAI